MSPLMTMGVGLRAGKKAGSCVLSRAESDDTSEVKCTFMESAASTGDISSISGM